MSAGAVSSRNLARSTVTVKEGMDPAIPLGGTWSICNGGRSMTELHIANTQKKPEPEILHPKTYCTWIQFVIFIET